MQALQYKEDFDQERADRERAVGMKNTLEEELRDTEARVEDEKREKAALIEHLKENEKEKSLVEDQLVHEKYHSAVLAHNNERIAAEMKDRLDAANKEIMAKTVHYNKQTEIYKAEVEEANGKLLQYQKVNCYKGCFLNLYFVLSKYCLNVKTFIGLEKPAQS